MAWPFTSAPAPSFDTGFVVLNGTPAVNVPNLTGATAAWLMGMHFANANAGEVQVTVTDNAGAIIGPAMFIAGNSVYLLVLDFLPVLGLKWFASTASGVTGKIWGYK